MVGKKIIWIILPLLITVACKGHKKDDFNPRFIKNASYILQTNEQDFFEKHQDYLSGQLFDKAAWNMMRTINPGVHTLVHFFQNNGSTDMLALLSPDDTIPFKRRDTLNHNGKVYYKFIEFNKDFYYLPGRDYSIVSDNHILIEKLIRTLPGDFMGDEKVAEFQHFTNPEASGHWFIFPSQASVSKSVFIDHGFVFKHLGEAVILDLENTGEHAYSGIAVASPSTRNISEIFEQVSPFESHPEAYLPAGTERCITLNFDSFDLFNKSWSDFKTYTGYRHEPLTVNEFKSLKSVTQSGGKANGYAVSFFGSEPEKLLGSFSIESTHNDVEIYRTGKDSLLLGKLFFPLFRKQSYPYAIAYDRYVIWSPTLEAAKKLIADIDNNRVLAATETFRQMREKTASEYHLGAMFDEKFFTLTRSGDMLFVNFKAPSFATGSAGKNTSGKAPRNQWKKLSGFKSAYDFQVAPQWIYNHRTKKYEIIYQDTQNRLVLVDAKGKIKWKKDIGEPITGRIHQVDMFKNGKRQLLFSTAKGIYLLDILGNYIKPFPLKMDLSAPVAVFDYDHNKNYRIGVARNNRVEMYDLKARRVKGFSPVKLTAELQFPPQHLRIKDKDYIFLQQKDGTLRIVNRRGKDRIKIKEKIKVKIPWFVHKNRFYSVSSKGELIHLDTRGKMSVHPDYSGIKDARFAANRSLILGEKTVWINGKKIDVPESQFAYPRIVFYNKKPYYVFIDKAAKEVVIYDGKTMTRLSGDYQADILPKKQAMYLLTRYLPEEIIIYYYP